MNSTINDDGFDLSEDVLYTMNVQAAADILHHVFAVTIRLLTLGADGRVTLS